MIKCVYPTFNTKTGLIAATYRSGTHTIFGSCPASCPLLPKQELGTTDIDWNYYNIEASTVPRNGLAWSYTHFKHTEIVNKSTNTYTLNYSTDTLEDAITSYNAGFPTVYAALWTHTIWPKKIRNINFIRCPAEINETINCQNCGGNKPLCTRQNRNYIVVFVKHGTLKKEKTGACYGALGNCKLQWNGTLNGTGQTTWDESKDPERLIAWAASLPKGTLLRHRIVGDLGKSPNRKITPLCIK